MRKIIAALIVSLDGYIEGPNGELDWIDSGKDPSDITGQIDTCILGAKMYPGYEQYWSAVHSAPGQPLPFSGKAATQGEMDYARFAMHTSHVVLSSSLQTAAWPHTRIVRNLGAVASLKQQGGKDMHAVGGAALVSSLMNAGLVDELRLVVVPILLGAGKPLFQGLLARHALHLVSATVLPHSHTKLVYTLSPASSPSAG